ncbi:hypothetical protein Acr_12g0001570 [Actinidia rufa]|uniref:Uncharacterized protein n=1 Tax=Actinidia rufa TaxID=165716 RepID=A0A7J0FGQ7_9ERIC|nr:hypothetical protein Acr_12g0001570 [Actinidia rufa]
MWTLLLLMLLVPKVVAPLVVLEVFQPLVLNPLVQPIGIMSAPFVMLLTIACLLVLFGFANTITSESTTITTGVSSIASASSMLIDVNDILALVQQILIAFGNPSTVCFGNLLLPCLPLQLSSSLTPPNLTDSSIELFPEDFDVPAVLPNDTLHVAPPTIVYLVESSSTDPALQFHLLFIST